MVHILGSGQGINYEDIDAGMVLAEPGSLSSFCKFRARSYVLIKEDGGRENGFENGFRPQFFIRNFDVTGTIQLENGLQKASPDTTIDMEVTLIVPYPVEVGMEFGIRDGGSTIGIGVITQIIN